MAGTHELLKWRSRVVPVLRHPCSHMHAWGGKWGVKKSEGGEKAQVLLTEIELSGSPTRPRVLWEGVGVGGGSSRAPQE